VRCLHVITGLSVGGAEMMLYKLLAGLRGHAMHSSVVSLAEGGPMQARIESLGVEVRSARMVRGGPPTPAAMLRLVALLRRFRPDVVQGWMYHGNLAATAAATMAGMPRPVLWNVRSSLAGAGTEKRRTEAVIRLGARFSGRPTRIVYVSRASAQQHEAIGYAASKRVLIPNGFATDEFRPVEGAGTLLRRQLGLPDDCLVVGHVARWHPVKDHATLLRAAALLLSRLPHARFVLAGHGVDAANGDLRALIDALGITDRVFLLGERGDLAEVTAGFDVATSSSSSEAFSNVLGEAMSCGVPCVATDVGDSAAIVADAGITVPPRNPVALADAWEAILTAPDTRLAMGRAARDRVLRHYSLDAVAGEYARLYAETLSGRGSGPRQRAGLRHG